MARRGWLAAAAVAGVAAWAAKDLRVQFGAAASGDRAERIARSPQWRDGKFRNTVPSTTLSPSSVPKFLREFLFGGEKRKPASAVPLVAPSPSASPMSFIWYGHSSALVEIEGRRVLFDPVWSERVSPSKLVGPKRLHPVPVLLAEVPPVDAIVISHDHYDHLDLETVRVLLRDHTAPFLVPLGVGAHLEAWGVPDDRIIELDWDDRATVAGLTFIATAARHFSGRAFNRDTTLWASWVVAGDSHKLFYSGDSGYFDGYAAVGAEHGPFDLTMIQVGAYGPNWPDIHMTPEQGVQAHLDLRGKLLLPLHWATFNLSTHAWAEPVERLWTEAKARGVDLVVPRPGERVDVATPPSVDGWWQAVA